MIIAINILAISIIFIRQHSEINANLRGLRAPYLLKLDLIKFIKDFHNLEFVYVLSGFSIKEKNFSYFYDLF